MAFAYIFEVCMGGHIMPDALPARRAYGSVIAFQGRSAMVQAAVEGYLNAASQFEERAKHVPIDELSKEFREVLNLSRKYSARRNEIAHGYVREWSIKNDDPNGYALFPTTYSTNKHTLTEADEPGYFSHFEPWPDYIYTSAEIDAYGNRFAELAERTHALWGRFLDTLYAGRRF